MIQQFTFSGLATIAHVNPRKEGPGEHKVLAVDVKFAAVTDCYALDYFDPRLANFLFRPDRVSVRNPALGALHYDFELEGYRFAFDGNEARGAQVKKFCIEARAGGVVILGFTVTFRPSKREVAELAAKLTDDVQILLQAQNGELALFDAVRKELLNEMENPS